MKNVIKVIAAVALVASSAVQAASTKPVRFEGDVRFASFCKAVVLDDVRILRSSLARNVGRIGGSQREVLRLVTAEDGLTCNGTSLVEFSRQREANAVYQYLTARS